MQLSIQAQAAERGFTQAVALSGGCYDLEGYVRPDCDLDGRFTMIDADTGERLGVNGWLFNGGFVPAWTPSQ